MKVKLAERGITLKSYVLGLIEKDLRNTEREVDIDAVRAAAEKAQEGLSEVLALTER
nr:MAG TPA: hypothetical protein [Caudoviricetes sp.]